MKNRGWRVSVGCGLIVLGACAFLFSRSNSNPPRRNPAKEFSDAVADVVERVMPSVVVIRTEAIQYRVKRDFFGFAYQVPEQLAGEGSGVIIDERGYIITSRHVLVGAQQIEVVLNDGTKLPAQLVGHDEATDLAILKIDTNGFKCPVVEFGNSDQVRVGEVVIAIGSPFSLQSSVTVGHVSQKGRRIQILPYEDFIQTDAAINEGNSGGPLMDVEGRLIGINAAIQADASSRAVGIAFAVPSNLAMVIAKSLIKDGKHDWPWVGAAFGTTDGQAVVTQIWRDTSAAAAGLQPGDVVERVNGIAVKNQFDVYRNIFSHAVGESLRFQLRRGVDTSFDYDLKLEQFPHAP